MTDLSDRQISRLRGLVGRPELSGTKYELGPLVAHGGMGTVYEALDRDLGRRVALKVLAVPDDRGDLTRRMLREAAIVAQLEHPGIVPIHEVGRVDDGRVYYTMKYVEGQTLEAHRRENPPLMARLRLFERVCEAVEFAHSKGVIHRDLKPSNIMIGPFGEVLVMDWGIASVIGQESGSVSFERVQSSRENIRELTDSADATQPGTVLGTPSYMSPEQAEGKSDTLDRRADIYSLGAILYFLLTGRPAIRAEAHDEALSLVTNGDFPSPRSLNHDLHKRLEAICLKAMALSPDDRYQHAIDLFDDIRRYSADEPVSAYPEGMFAKLDRWLRANRFIVGIVLVYIIVRLVILFWLGR